MKNKKIVIVSWKEVDNLVLLKNHVQELSKSNYILILDISKILNLNTSKKKFFIKSKKIKIKYLKNKTQLKKIIHQTKPVVIILSLMENYSEKTKKIYYLIKNTKFKVAKFLDTTFITYKSYFKNKLLHSFLNSKFKYDYLIEVGSRKIYHFYDAPKKIYSHHYDYESFLKEKFYEKKVKKKNYAVFLDENFIFHPDLTLNKRKKWVSGFNYKKDMTQFFKNYKKNFNLDIKIAGHPTSKVNFFKGFKMYKNKTIQLVKNAKIVFLHHSTALSFPVLFKKKMLFLTSNEIDKTFQTGTILNRAKFFDKKPININDEFNKEKIINETVNFSFKYTRFIDFFLKHPLSKKEKFSDTFLRYINF